MGAGGLRAALPSLLPTFLPFLAGAAFLANAERMHRQFLEGVSEASRAFVQDNASSPLVFFGPLFLVVAVLTILVTLGALLAKTRLRITPNGVTYTRTVFGLVTDSRQIACADLWGIRLQDSSNHRSKSRDVVLAWKPGAARSDTAAMRDTGQISFACGLRADDIEWLRRVLPDLLIPNLDGSTESTASAGAARPTKPAEIVGYDREQTDPETLAFHPNARRTTNSLLGLVLAIVFVTLWEAMLGPIFLSMLGILHLRVDPKNPGPTDPLGRLVLGSIMGVFTLVPLVAFVSFAAGSYRSEVRHRKTPLVLDWRRDELRLGDQEVVCRLSDIERLEVVRVYPYNTSVMEREVSVRASYTITARLRHEPRTFRRWLGWSESPQRFLGDQEAEAVLPALQEAADFIGVPIDVRTKIADPPIKSMG